MMRCNFRTQDTNIVQPADWGNKKHSGCQYCLRRQGAKLMFTSKNIVDEMNVYDRRSF